MKIYIIPGLTLLVCQSARSQWTRNCSSEYPSAELPCSRLCSARWSCLLPNPPELPPLSSPSGHGDFEIEPKW